MKVKKGNKSFPLITGEDVIITTGTQSSKTVDEAIDNQQKEIDKLKSNLKYIYSYGGVGGNGSGSGSSSSGKSTSFVARLGGHKLENGGSSIILNEPGTYTFVVNVRDSNGETFYVRYSVGGGDMSKPQALSTELNMCEYTTTVNLQTNSNIVVEFLDSDGSFLDSITQSYIVSPHTFTVKFKYKYNNGQSEGEFSSQNEYFIGDTNHTNPFIDISYRIDIPGITNIQIKYEISDVDDGTKVIPYTESDITNNHLKIKLEDLKRNGEDFLKDSNTGNYNVSVTLSYSSSGESVSETNSFVFTIIPNYLYINVRNPQDLFYNTFDEIITAKSNGEATEDEGGIPEKNITAGSYTSIYCKVYEGEIKTTKKTYTVKCSVYDYIDDSEYDSEIIYDENNFNSIASFSDTISVTEQVESVEPFSVPFSTNGIKKIVFETSDSKYSGGADGKSTIKYIYARKPIESINWYPETIELDSYYFRSNCGDDTYSENFPQLSSGTQPLELKISDSSTLSINNTNWETIPNNCDTTILSLGIQYNQINSDGSEILRTYSEENVQTADITLYPDYIFDAEGEIRIPYESSFNKSDVSKYHLVQIVRTKIDEDENIFATYLYVDGILESVQTSTSDNNLYIGKIVFNNINVAYNLINIQYINKGSYTADELVYQYYLKYKERMRGETISVSEKAIFNCFNNHSIVFDGTNVVMEETTVEQIAPDMPIPTMMLSYTNSDETESKNFVDALFRGYGNGENGAFGTKFIKLFWCDGLKDNENTSLHEIVIPTISGGLTGTWFVKLQGTSTMRNRIKNFSVGIQTENNENDEKILVSPNYDSSDKTTYLPEQIWTIKADIADSAHANNTSIGKFVNKTCTQFQTGQNYSTNAADYIKNTLEGFPVMMYFKINNEVYYLGVYNFNMGRDSYYNLGYYTAADTEEMINNISHATTGFAFSKGKGLVMSSLTIGEIQENLPQFDFHQYGESVLFQGDNSSVTKMFGKDSKITYGSTINKAKSTLANFVKQVAIAGAYCFGNVGKDAVSSKGSDTYNSCVDKYAIENTVPDLTYQMKYDASDNLTWTDNSDKDITFEKCANNEDNLLKCIYSTLSDGTTENKPYLDYTSASEYYTICMAFGLIDSVMKNMNIKSWDDHKCYICFYDMDCALEEDNSGDETVSYLAATDYWYSNKTNGYLEPVTNNIKWDYWDDTVGKGFDCKSSYLFAIVKYAQAILNSLDGNTIKLTHYPQEFWAHLRKPTGELRSADYFVDNYFKSGIGSIPSYMASMDYQVKYLYKGKTLTDSGEESEEKYLANASAFHGSRVFKVRDWLNKRLHFLDAMFNVQSVNIAISQGVYVPIPDDTELMDSLRQNSDISILQDAFSTTNKNESLMGSNGVLVNMYAPMNTPIVMVVGNTSQIYLLSEGINKPNPIMLNVSQPAITIKCLGSKELTNVSMIEPFLTKAFQIVSDKLEEITFGGSSNFQTQTNSFTITSTSVKKIKMNIPGFNGSLNISSTGSYGQSVNELDISGSGFYGSWDMLGNLQKLNISSVVASKKDIKVTNCKMLTGENCTISGSDSENRTSLKTLSMSDISGSFLLNNTAIEEISMSATDEKNAEFEINGDKLVRKINLTGFSKIKISDCQSLESITINDGTVNKCKNIRIDVSNKCTTLTKFNSDIEGVFDFTKYTSLETIGLTGSSSVEVIKIPDKKVSVTSFANNTNLEFVDTAGKSSCIELTDKESFYGCHHYGMRQSWASSFDNNNIGLPLYTRMCIGENCKTLASTFNKGISGDSSKYLSTTYESTYKNPSTGENQLIKNIEINLSAAKYFLNTVVGGGYLDDTYYDTSSNTIINPSGDKNFKVSDYRKNITSLNQCFEFQTNIINDSTGSYTYPDLSGYKNLTDIAGMYKYTGITYIDSDLLSLPYELNTNESSKVEFAEFAKNGEINIAKDALKNISYRISEINSQVFKIVTKDGTNDGSSYENKIDILDVFCPRIYESDGSDNESGEEGVDYIVWKDNKYIINERLITFTSFNISPSQYVDYTRLFELCPYVSNLSYFLNCDLSKAIIANVDTGIGMLKNCTHLSSITDSFSHTGLASELSAIDLYKFFNWGENTGMTSLFSNNVEGKTPGFVLNKTISNEDFKTILGLLHNYQSITKLTNLFNFCTIVGYDGSEIKLSGNMPNVTYLDSLFYKCVGNSSGDLQEDVPLNIRRTFFKKLPNVQSLLNTFGYVHFAHMLTYDFFCKYKETTSNVYVKFGNGENDYENGTLTSFSYGSYPITTMYNCFKCAKFVKCKCWFDPNSTDADSENQTNITLKPKKETVIGNGTNSNGISYTSYYAKEGGKYVEHKLEDPVAILDTVNNFTNYVSEITVSSTSFAISNHDISSDLLLYSNGDEIYTSNEFGVYPTYCCLPPDIFHACYRTCDLTGVFSNSNIIGVIPQHLVIKCYSGKIGNMLENTNILPNVIYHYNKNYDNNSDYLTLISEIPIDDTTITVKKSIDDTTVYELDTSVGATVLFRDGDGILKRRHPRLSYDSSDSDSEIESYSVEYSKSQFVYVPQGFTTNNNLTNAFSFRYNLPQNTDLIKNDLSSKGWPSDNTGNDSYSPEYKPELWPYYVQYFFLSDESINWSGITSMKYPFITDSQDMNFDNSLIRQFSTEIQGVTYNLWYENRETFDKSRWTTLTNGVFNSFLNLCGERDTRTGLLSDSGCILSKSINNQKYPKLDSFVSGILTIFLNGKIFDNSVDAARLSGINKEGSNIIQFNGFGKNIILPRLLNLYDEDKDDKVVLTWNEQLSQFYEFMFSDSTSETNYISRYFGGRSTFIQTSDNGSSIVKYKLV